MKLFFHKTGKGQHTGVALIEDHLVFAASRPVVIQPSEIVKVPTDMMIKVPNKYVLNISTRKDFAAKGLDLFPGLIVVDCRSETLIQLPVRNNGRSQVNIMPGTLIANGYVCKIEPIEMGEFDPKTDAAKELPKTKPQKKNSIEFEVIE